MMTPRDINDKLNTSTPYKKESPYNENYNDAKS